MTTLSPLAPSRYLAINGFLLREDLIPTQPFRLKDSIPFSTSTVGEIVGAEELSKDSELNFVVHRKTTFLCLLENRLSIALNLEHAVPPFHALDRRVMSCQPAPQFSRQPDGLGF